jgi:uncharacterized protein
MSADRFMKTKKFRFGLVIAGLLAASVTFALPTPSEIDQAVHEGQYQKAESMLREVIAEKPQSAKAHYELGVLLERRERYLEAQTELRQAQTLDSSLKFTKDPQNFERQLEHVNQKVREGDKTYQKSENSIANATPLNQASQSSSGVSSLTLVWVVIAGLVIVALFVKRSAPSPVVVEVPQRPQGFGGAYTPNSTPPGYPPAGGYPSYPPASSGSGVAGAVVGGVAGLAAGYALAKAMEGDHSSNVVSGNALPQGGGFVANDNSGMNTDGQVDNFASFEPSAGDSWDNSSANLAGDASDDNSW